MRIILFALLVFLTQGRWLGAYRKMPFAPVPENVLEKIQQQQPLEESEPVVITPDVLNMAEIDKQRIREASRVHIPQLVKHNGAGNQPNPFAYSGYLNVDANCNSNMFYWFFESADGNQNAPIILWLQGGPGGTSMFGLFAENGPYYLTPSLQLLPRNITWNEHYAMLYIDNPVGVGFSYNNGQTSCYSQDETAVGTNLYNALALFFSTYSQYQNNDFYVSGESYAGKYIPAVCYTILQQNSLSTANPLPPIEHMLKEHSRPATNKLFSSAVRIPLVGMAIGDGWTDPREMVQQYAPLAYAFGLVSVQERAIMDGFSQQIVRDIDAGNWMAAAQGFETYVDGPPDYFQNVTGCSNYYDMRKTVEPVYGGNYDVYLNQTAVRQALHVGNLHVFDSTSDLAGYLLTVDLAKSMKPLLPTLFENIKTLIYNGNMDFIVGASLTERYLETVQWSGANGYKSSNKIIWKVAPSDVEVAGYARNYGSFTQVVVRDAGHILPFDQPRAALDMITRFVEDLPFTD